MLELKKFEISKESDLARIRFGIRSQIIKLGEEFGELCKASFRGEYEYNFIEEAVDCQIVLDSIMSLFTPEQLNAVYEIKLEKLKRYLDASSKQEN